MGVRLNEKRISFVEVGFGTLRRLNTAAALGFLKVQIFMRIL